MIDIIQARLRPPADFATSPKKSGKRTQFTRKLKNRFLNTGIITPANHLSTAPVRLNRLNLAPIGLDDK